MNLQPTKEYMIFQRRHPEDLDRGERTALAASAVQPLFSRFAGLFAGAWRVLVRIFRFATHRTAGPHETADQELLTTERMLRSH